MAKLVNPRSVSRAFKKYKLGTTFKYLVNGHTYHLMRRTHPQTLEGTLYLICKDTNDRIETIVTKEWEPL